MAQQITPAMFDILLALSGGESHGYGIMSEVRARSGSRLGPATLYRSLGKLLDEGLIEESDERPDPELDDERRRYYRLTEAGAGAAAAEAARLSVLVSAARARGLLKPSRGSAG
jgi:DNA-binding PadR family transcriptional regulator